MQSLSPVGVAGTESILSHGFPSGAGEIAHLVDVRAAGHETFDRVVLEFDGDDMPSYRVTYVQPPVLRDGSGGNVSLAGDAFLELRLTPASGWDLTGAQPRRTYDGPERLRPPFGTVVAEVVRTGDFEATLAWTVGLGYRAPFAVAMFDGPLRLVVDILHEPAAPKDT